MEPGEADREAERRATQAEIRATRAECQAKEARNDASELRNTVEQQKTALDSLQSELDNYRRVARTGLARLADASITRVRSVTIGALDLLAAPSGTNNQ